MGIFDFFKPKPKFPPGVYSRLEKIFLVAFPGGPQQIEEETVQLHVLLRGSLTKKESGDLLQRTKPILVTSKDKSEERITSRILGSANGKLSQHEAHLVYTFLTGISGPSTARDCDASSVGTETRNANEDKFYSFAKARGVACLKEDMPNGHKKIKHPDGRRGSISPAALSEAAIMSVRCQSDEEIRTYLYGNTVFED